VSFIRSNIRESCPEKPIENGAATSSLTFLALQLPILLDGEKIGSLYLRQDLQRLWDDIGTSALIGAAVMVGCLLLSAIMTSVLQRVISDPIANLANVANNISSSGDYSIRAQELGADEVGQMVRAFNDMVQQIESRDEQLEKAQEQLMGEVEQRSEANRELESTMSDLRNTQKQLVETEKMASLGGLVAGVAHEINTPVGVAFTAASMLSGEAAAFGEAFRGGSLKKSSLERFVGVSEESSRLILGNLERAAHLIQSFKQVAVDQSSDELRSFAIDDYFSEVLLSLRPNLKKRKVEVTLDCEEDLVMRSHPGAWSQILTNLLMNSLAHGYDEGDEGVINISAHAVADKLVVVYTEDGRGMDEATRKQVFDPFFTTRRGSGGSGLGMHILFNLVNQTLGGKVKLESELGAGVRIEIVVPFKKDERDE
jgi:signal transduction histidine kinase